MNFADAAIEARKNTALVKEFNRLTGRSLRPYPGIARGVNDMIDDATGRTEAGEMAFIEFFDEFIWSRLPDKTSTGAEGC